MEILEPSDILPFSSQDKLGFLTFAMVLMDQVWFYINITRLKEKVPTWEHLGKTIPSSTLSFVNVVINRKIKKKNLNIDYCWRKAPSGFVKLHFDACLDQNGNMVSDVLTRDAIGEIICAWIERDVAEKAFKADAELALLALKVAQNRGYSKAIFEGDALHIVRTLNGHAVKMDWIGIPIIEVALRILASKPQW